MLLPLVLLAALHSVPADDAPADVTKGSSLMRGCEAELHLLRPDQLATASQGDLVNGSYCVGYVNGFLANTAPGQGSYICPTDQPMAAVIYAYVEYMQQNPRLLEQDKRIGLRLALQSAFPCPASGKLSGLAAPGRRNQL